MYGSRCTVYRAGEQPVVFGVRAGGEPVAVERGRDDGFDLPAVVQNGGGEDLVGAIGQARQPGHVLLPGQGGADRLID